MSRQIILGSILTLGLLGNLSTAQAASMVPRELGMPGSSCRAVNGAAFNSLYTADWIIAGMNNTNARLTVQCVVPSVTTLNTSLQNYDALYYAHLKYWDNSSDTTGWNGTYTNGDLFCDATVIHADGSSLTSPRRYSCSAAGGCSTDQNGTFYNTFDWYWPDALWYGVPTSVVFTCNIPAGWSGIYTYSASFYSRD